MEQALDLEPQSLTAPPGSPGKKAVSTVSFDDDPLAALRPPAGPVIAGTAKAAVRTPTCWMACKPLTRVVNDTRQ